MLNLSKFSEKLKEYMDERNISAPALAKIIGTDRTNVTRYLRGERAPRYECFLKLLSFFCCSADYLLGLSDYPSERELKDAQPFCERFRFVLSYGKKTQYRLERDLHISGSSVCHWLAGKTFPSLANLVNVAEYIQCTVDFLLGRED